MGVEEDSSTWRRCQSAPSKIPLLLQPRSNDRYMRAGLRLGIEPALQEVDRSAGDKNLLDKNIIGRGIGLRPVRVIAENELLPLDDDPDILTQIAVVVPRHQGQFIPLMFERVG